MDLPWVDACIRDGRNVRDFGVDASLENSQQNERPLLCAGARRTGWRAIMQATATLEVLSGDELVVSRVRRGWYVLFITNILVLIIVQQNLAYNHHRSFPFLPYTEIIHQ